MRCDDGLSVLCPAEPNQLSTCPTAAWIPRPWLSGSASASAAVEANGGILGIGKGEQRTVFQQLTQLLTGVVVVHKPSPVYQPMTVSDRIRLLEASPTR